MATKFSVQVAKRVMQENLVKGKNVICSPASIDAVLSMVAVGAVNKTQQQFLKLLGHRDIPELKTASSNLVNVLKAPQTSYANAMLLDQQYSVKAEYEKVMRDVHNAHVKIVDFVNQRDQAVNEANKWAKKATKGLIKQILTSNNIKPDTALLLANALHFKGYWKNRFDARDTVRECFNLLNGHQVRVPFMEQRREYYDYGVFHECQVLRMPYKNGDNDDDDDDDRCGTDSNTNTYAMYVFLPFEKDGLPSVMEDIRIDQNMFEEKIKLDNVKVDELSIPKFKFESDIDLKNIMKQLGLTLPFEENCMDFSGIADSDDLPLYVSDIFQKCRIKTDELGTEAAGVTWLDGEGASLPPPPKIRFVADHPFMFMIREDVSGAILFIGTMLDPKSRV